MQSTTTLELNLQYPNHATTMYAVQNDRLSRKISAVLADGATAWTPPSGTLAAVRYAKPDGTEGFYTVDEGGNTAVTWTGNVATVMLVEQALTVAGDVNCQINFYNSSQERLSTFRWVIKVQECVITDNAIVSTDYFNILTEQIAEILEVYQNLPSPYTSTPKEDGTGSAGSSSAYARGDHRHPSDTSRVPTTRKVNNKALSSNVTVNASDIPNDSTVSGENVDDALDNLNTALSNIDFANATNVTTASQDLDNYTDGGIWYFGSSYTPTNKPSDSGSFGFLITINGGSVARLFQIWLYTARSGTNMWIRSTATNTVNWGDWKRLLTSADMTAKDISSVVSIASPLPTGVTSAYVTALQAGNIVTVHISVIRDSNPITNFSNGQIATGLPVPAVVPTGGSNVVIPFGEISAATATNARPLLCTVNSSGNLQVRYGAEVSTYNGSFTYLTNDFSNL